MGRPIRSGLINAEREDYPEGASGGFSFPFFFFFFVSFLQIALHAASPL